MSFQTNESTQDESSASYPDHFYENKSAKVLFFDTCYAIVVWTQTIVLSLFFSLAVLILFPFVSLFDRERHLLHTLAITWARCVWALNPRATFTVEGKSNIPAKDVACVYVANHQSQADILALFVLGIRFRWLAKSSLFWVPFAGWAMRAVGYIPVLRQSNNSRIRCMKESHERLKAGTPMAFFPEGTRSSNGQLGSFKAGAFRLACAAQVPVVPITLIGTSDFLPKGAIIPRRAQVKIIVHPAVSSVGKSPKELAEICRSKIATSLENPIAQTRLSHLG